MTTGNLCPFCQTVIMPGQPAVVCDVCGMPHHADCWTENGGCTTFGCVASPVGAQARGAVAVPPVLSPGVPIELTVNDPEQRCSNCGWPVDEYAYVCRHCGRHITHDVSTYPPPPSHSYDRSYKSPVAACLLNLLLLGAGYFYLGQVGKGIGVLVVSVIAGCFTYGVGTVIGLIYAMVDCYSTAQRMNLGSPY